MTGGLDLGGGEESPPMPEIPYFLRRDKGGLHSGVGTSTITIVEELPAIITGGAGSGGGAGSKGGAIDGASGIRNIQDPTEEEILSTIRKLAEKRNKIDGTILGLKEQLIGMVRDI